MTAEKELRDQKFRDWKKDLDKRCDEHLKNNPEHKPTPKKKPMYARRFLPPPPTVDAKIRVTVTPHATIDGAWCVYKDGEKLITFFGLHAQVDATKFAADMLNDGDLNV